jgi:ribosomal protein L1
MTKKASVPKGGATVQEPAKEVKLAAKQTTEDVAMEAATAIESTAKSSTEATKEVAEEAQPKPTAKAGKRSAKALAETEEKIAKQAHKATKAAAEKQDVPKLVIKPSRSRLERRGKKFQEAAKLISTDKAYNVNEATELATKTSPVKFDATVELHVRLNVDPRQADQNIRDIVALPAGTGKTVRVAVFADVDDVAKAKKAGADIAGGDEFLASLDKGEINFDVLVATPAQMPKLGKYARVLGPKGLMPNPKSGTVTADVAKAVKDAKAGRVEYRVDSTGIIHVGVGKVSFGSSKLTDNTQAIIGSIKSNKPSSIKGPFIRSAFLTTSMGPSIRLELTEI